MVTCQSPGQSVRHYLEYKQLLPYSIKFWQDKNFKGLSGFYNALTKVALISVHQQHHV